MRAFTTICALIAVPLAAYAGDDAAKKAPAAGAPAVAPKAPPADPPKPTPAKELDMVKPFAKGWTCTGSNPKGDKLSAKMSFKLDLDKFWYAVRMDVVKNKVPSFTGMAWMGMDPAVKGGWIFEGADSHGGNIHLKATAAGVTAEQMVFEGEAADPAMGKAPMKFTFKLDGKTKHLSVVGEFGGQKGFEYDCK